MTEIITEEMMLAEVLDVNTAKYIEFKETPKDELPGIPTLKFQTEFKTDSGKEYAFRVFRQPEMGRHARRMLFTLKSVSTGKLSQNVVFDYGTFKKVLVTFLKSYQMYKETADGKAASSYNIVFPTKFAQYAPLIVRVIKRAFKNEPRVKLELVGASEEKDGVHLFYVNKQSMFPYFGGKAYDENFVTTNPFYLQLAGIAAKADDVTDAPAVVADVKPVEDKPAKAPKADRLNPDGIPGLNDPVNFNHDFVKAAFTAAGRDALEAVFKAHKIHRRYFAANIDKAIEMWAEVKGDIKHYPSVDDILEGVGFYLKRAANDNGFKAVMSHAVVVMAERVENADVIKLAAAGALVDDPVMFAPLALFLMTSFVRDALMPVQHDVRERHAEVLKALDAIGFSAVSPAVVMNYPTSAVAKLHACVAMNSIGASEFGIGLFDHAVFDDVLTKTASGVYATADEELLRKIRVITDRYGVGTVSIVKAAPIVVGDGQNAFISALNTKDRHVVHAEFLRLKLDEKSDESYKTLQEILATLKTSNQIDTIEAFQTLHNCLSALGYGSVVAGKNYKLMMSALASRSDAWPSTVKIITHIISYDSDVDELFDAIASACEESYEQFMRVAKGLIEGGENRQDPAIIKRVAAIDLEYQYTANNIDELVKLLGSHPDDLKGTYQSGAPMVVALIGAARYPKYHQLVGMYSAIKKLGYSNFMVAFNTLFSTHDNADTVTDYVKQAFLSGDYTDRVNRDRLVNQNNGSPQYVAGVHRALTQIQDELGYDMRDALYSVGGLLAEQSIKGNNQELIGVVGQKSVADAIRNNPGTVYRVAQSNDGLPDEVPAFVADAVADAIVAVTQRPDFERGSSYYYYMTTSKETMVNALTSLNSAFFDSMSAANLEKMKTAFGKINATSTTKRSYYQPVLDKMADMLSEVDRSKTPGLSQQFLDACEDRERRLLVKSIGKNLFFNRYMSEFKDHSKIKIGINLNKKNVSSILNFNNISMAKLPNITEKDNIESAKRKVSKVDLGLPDEKIEKIELSREQLEDLSIEYDAFNRKKHNLSLLIEESFKVSIPRQIEGRAAWDARMAAEGIESRIMAPVFHGTGSVAAAMILRLGFAVSSLDDTKKTGVKVAGRMLGDGVYFSTAIDKVAQYASDGGYGRKLGDYGYIFEMNASLGRHRYDFREAGTGSRFDERRNVISPEWAVFSPNEQLVITKAHKIKRVPHHVIDKLKKKRMLKEGKNSTAIRGFREVIREALGYEEGKMVTFIFADGRIPVGDKLIDFEDCVGNELGKDVRIEGGQLGAMVTFVNAKVSDDGVDIYHIDMTGAFVADEADPVRKLYFELLGE